MPTIHIYAKSIYMSMQPDYIYTYTCNSIKYIFNQVTIKSYVYIIKSMYIQSNLVHKISYIKSNLHVKSNYEYEIKLYNYMYIICVYVC